MISAIYAVSHIPTPKGLATPVSGPTARLLHHLLPAVSLARGEIVRWYRPGVEGLAHPGNWRPRHQPQWTPSSEGDPRYPSGETRGPRPSTPWNRVAVPGHPKVHQAHPPDRGDRRPALSYRASAEPASAADAPAAARPPQLPYQPRSSRLGRCGPGCRRRLS